MAHDGREWQRYEREVVPGILLFISCQKHSKPGGRVDRHIPKEPYINGWKVHVVIGDLTIEKDYIVQGKLITIKCEDSYVYLLKKVAMTFKVLLDLYDIQEGIFRINDSVKLNVPNLIKFLDGPKHDYMGRYIRYSLGPVLKNDHFMQIYYRSHPNELKDPMSGLIGKTADDIPTTRPDVTYVSGTMLYVSSMAAEMVHDEMKKHNYDVFYKNEHGHPYIIEDVGIGYILRDVKPRWVENFYINHTVLSTMIGTHLIGDR
jgi:hypothetical protein